VYGVGLKLDANIPHRVENVDSLVGIDGFSVGQSVGIGDHLLSVDGVDCATKEMSFVGELIKGPSDSLATLEFLSPDTGRYHVVVKRHVPAATQSHRRGWMEVREQFRGKSLLADDSIVDALEGIRSSLTAERGGPIDAFKLNHTHVHTGIEFSTADPRRVANIVQGSPAWSDKGIISGDEVLNVDGIDTNDSNIQVLV
jgi:C-terminal processing protease CtpA/Prc